MAIRSSFRELTRFVAELEKYLSESVENEEDETEVVDSLSLNKDSVAVDPKSGLPLTTREMTVNNLRTELEAKGLSSEGSKSVLVRRIRVHLTLRF